MPVTYLLVPISEENKAVLYQLNIIKTEDIHETCRICLRQEEKINLSSLYDTNGYFESMSISTAILECFGLMIDQDVNVSSYICSACVTKVQDAYTFKSTILKAEKVITAPLKILESIDNQAETENTLRPFLPTYREEEEEEEEEEERILTYITTLNEIETKEKSAVSPVPPISNNVLTTPLKEESNSVSASVPKLEINVKSILGKLLTAPLTNRSRSLKTKKNKNINDTQTTTLVTSSKLKPKVKRTYERRRNKNEHVRPTLNNEITSSPLMSEHSYSKLVDGTFVKSTESENENGENSVPPDNLGTKVTEETPVTDNNVTPEIKKYSIKPLSNSFEKWWFKGCGPPYQCKLCGRDYGARYSVFYAHVRTHFIKKFPCTYCGKRFINDKLKVHMRSHTNERPYVCEQCPARFISTTSLKRHRLSHTGEKPFICDVCGKGYSQNSSMQTHMETHYKTTGCVCEICGVTLRNYGAYGNHKTKHKMDTSSSEHNEKFPCNQCNAVFSKSQSLTRHYKIHNYGAFKCTICDASFTESYSCEVHTFMHEVQSYETDLMSLHCKFCFDIFNDKKNLEEHLLTHLSNPHKCKNCNKSFPTKLKLRAHLRKYSGTIEGIE
ncbi:hypothetical protein RI129_003196 [Pyrocoelia pectoralis]|uniref:Uncharacterized protein n=1 Tax=Pyrocoelia pectoralis TaxID=417401 RepID=A0AAN7VR84_9COLE